MPIDFVGIVVLHAAIDAVYDKGSMQLSRWMATNTVNPDTSSDLTSQRHCIKNPEIWNMYVVMPPKSTENTNWIEKVGTITIGYISYFVCRILEHVRVRVGIKIHAESNFNWRTDVRALGKKTLHFCFCLLVSLLGFFFFGGGVSIN